MIELLIVWAVLMLSWTVALAIAIRGARRRSRVRAERVLDALAAEACAALAQNDRSRRAARAIARYDRAQALVAAARTCGELEAAVAPDRLRLAGWQLAAQGAEWVRAMLPAGSASRR